MSSPLFDRGRSFRSVAVAAAILCLLCSQPALSQSRGSRETPQVGWLLEGTYRHALLLDDPVTYVGGRFGLQISPGFAVALAGLGMISKQVETRSVDGFERYESVLMLGPALEVSDSLTFTMIRFRVSFARWLFRVGVLGGLVDREVGSRGDMVRHTELMAAVDPEIGLIFRFGRGSLTTTVGMIYGRLLEPDTEIYSAPTAAFALRVLL